MYKNIQTYLILLLAVLGVACSDPLEAPDANLVAGAPGTLTIRFTNASLTRNAASDNSENYIENLVVGLYRDNISNEIPASAFYVIDGVKKYNSHEFTVQLSEALIAELFNKTGGNKCRIYAVANLPAGTFKESDRPTINELKTVPIVANFYTRDVQSSFVMAGGGVVSYTAPAAGQLLGSASGSATMKRAAAKINLNVEIPDTIHVGQTSAQDTNFEVWRPVPSFGIFSLLNCGVQKAVSVPETIVETSGGTVTEIPWKPQDTSAYYNSTLLDGSWRALQKTDAEEYPFRMSVPFYTFPNAWEEKPEEDYKTTLTLTVAWKKDGEEEQSWYTFFYQIPITPANMPQILRNHSYTINLKVGMLGALTREEPVVLENLSYQIVDWGSQDVDVDMQDFRYLVVDPNFITVNNEQEVTIPYYSSHPINVEDLTMTFQRFNYYSNGNGDVVNIEVNEDILNNSTWTHQIEENGVTKTVTDTICTVHTVRDPKTNQWMLKLTHPLAIWTPYNGNKEVELTDQAGSGEKTFKAKDLGITRFERPKEPETPYSSYTFKFKLCHADNDKYEQEIEVIQYPGMYIQADRNPGGVYISGYSTEERYNNNRRYTKYLPVSSDYGFVFVNPILTEVLDNARWNPNQEPFSYWENSTTLGGVHGVSGGNNSNPNMYVITISQLDSDSKYVIGDPRSNYINNSLTGSGSLIPTSDQTEAADIWCELATALYSNSTSTAERRLEYYYPTNEVPTSNPNAYRIAPKLRIASSYGKTNTLSRENARRRAATYQERAFPAGRWRLPTMGEIEFISSLSSTGKIPTLFSKNYTYWSAQGPCKINDNGTITLLTDNTSKYYIRPVYDEWYWEQYPQYSLSPSATSFDYTLGDVPRGVAQSAGTP